MTRRAAMLALFCLVVLAGCAARDSGSDDDNRRGTFYGGVSGGFTRP